MSVYKQVRKGWLKQLTRAQRKQFAGYVQDISDAMLEAYAETIRLKGKAGHDESRWLPIDDTGVDLKISIKLDPR